MIKIILLLATLTTILCAFPNSPYTVTGVDYQQTQITEVNDPVNSRWVSYKVSCAQGSC